MAIRSTNIKVKQIQHLEDKRDGLKNTLDIMRKAGLTLDGNAYAIEDEIRDIERQIAVYKETE